MPERKFPKPRKKIVDQEAVGKFLVGIGFNVETIAQEWRHLHAFGLYMGKPSVFKLASTQATGEKTQNEYKWNDAVHQTPEVGRQFFTVPKNYSSGLYGKLFYFISERFVGEALGGHDSAETLEVAQNLMQIARANREIEELSISPNSAFAQTKKARLQEKIPPGHRLLASASEWAQVVPIDVSPYLKIIEGAKDKVRACVTHGDFTIRQIFPMQGKIGIIDGEHAGLKGVMHYDTAYFYSTLRSNYNFNKEANEYLKIFQSLLPVTDRRIFWDELKPVLAQRFIGMLFSNNTNPNKLAELTPIGKEILRDKVL